MNDIILVGNPNVGKTTLFNTLTKSNERASNWHGVTVGAKKKDFRFSGESFSVVDLPGMYSLNGYSNEEKIAEKYLRENRNSLVINICDANNLKRNLMLTEELVKKSYNVILAVNMIDDFKEFDASELEKILGIKIVGIDARNNKSTKKLKSAIYDYYSDKNNKKNQNITNFDAKITEIDKYIYNLNKNLINKNYKKIDSIILNKFLFFPIFFSCIFFVFYLTFGTPGEIVSGIFSSWYNKFYIAIKDFINSLNMSHIVKDFLISGVLGSFSIIISFLPQIVILISVVSVIEDTGLMSRFAFMSDGILKKVGLTGKSLFSILLGYGCSASAMLTTRNLEKKSLRKRTALILPFATCSAKLPVFLTISSIFFDKYKYIFVFLLYLFSVFLIFIFSIIFKKFIPDNGEIFVLEMPKYRLPYLKKVISDAISTAKDFLFKIGTTIVFWGALFWILQNFSMSLKYLDGKNFSESILSSLSKMILPVFLPLKFNSPGIVSVLIFGLIAKELILVGIAMVGGASSGASIAEIILNKSSPCYFSMQTAIIFLIFVLIYSPCISTLSAIKNEFGKKTAVFVFAFQFIVAYIICLVVRFSLESKSFSYAGLCLIILAFLSIFVLKSKHKNGMCGDCNACRKIQVKG